MLSQQEAAPQATSAAWYELMGAPPDFSATYQARIRAVTAEEVQAAAQELIRYFTLAVAAPAN